MTKRQMKRKTAVRETSSTYGSPAKPYDLEARTEGFARDVRSLVRQIPNTLANEQDVRQLIRASGSVGANYIEANEALGNKDFLMHIKISRKEAKESRYWLRLLDLGDSKQAAQTTAELIGEATELMNIFGAIYRRKA